jgi:NAD-dependent dihydropyrimidine dehydrogenase PreA subunit
VEVHPHGVDPDLIDEAVGTEQPGQDPSDNVVFLIDDDVCTRCALCVDRCPTGVIILGKIGDSRRRRRPTSAHPNPWLRLWDAAGLSTPTTTEIRE